MTDLAGWLLLQVAQDERIANAADSYAQEAQAEWVAGLIAINDPDRRAAEHAAVWSPWRVLLECDVKRRMIEEARGWLDHDARVVADAMLRLLAAAYADRPGYLDEWQPE